MFSLGIVPLTATFTWIYNNTRRSTLAVILLHSMVNFSGELIALTERADAFWMGWFLVAAVVITAVWGPKTFTRSGRGQQQRLASI
jgi:membrane protease YdiL (CAAX protease family)